jgi:pimeloyl-ACP methyl ester carboxylesterase
VAGIYGSRSPLTRTEDLAWLRETGATTTLVDAAHNPHLAHPHEVASLVATFALSNAAQ